MRVLFFCFLLLIQTGCVRELDYQVPFEGERLVVYGVLSPDEPVAVQISKTFPVTGRSLYADKIVDNASVQLFENGNAVAYLPHQANGRYVTASGFTPKVGYAYHVEVTANGLPAATTVPEMVPAPVGIDKYGLGDTIAPIYAGGRTTRKLSVTLSDDPSAENTYILTIGAYYKGRSVTINSVSLDRPGNMGDLCGFRGWENYFLRDVCFNGQFTDVNFGIETSGFLQRSFEDSTSRVRIVACDSITLRVANVTKTYFEFLSEEGDQETGFLQAFSSISIEYTNVKGGYGILAGSNSQTLIIYP